MTGRRKHRAQRFRGRGVECGVGQGIERRVARGPHLVEQVDVLLFRAKMRGIIVGRVFFAVNE